MEMSIDITTADLSLITSGTFMTIDEKPIQMDVVIDNETTVSVLILFHNSFIRRVKASFEADQRMELRLLLMA